MASRLLNSSRFLLFHDHRIQHSSFKHTLASNKPTFNSDFKYEGIKVQSSSSSNFYNFDRPCNERNPYRPFALHSKSNKTNAENVINETALSENGVSDQDLDCVGIGLSVECFTPEFDSDSDAESESKVSTSESSSVQIKSKDDLIVNGSSLTDYQNSKLESSENTPENDALEPKYNSDALINGEAIGSEWLTLENLIATLILISPFFFWGTSMVVMKDLLPKTGSLFVASVRLIPSGLLLIIFASLTNRKSPETPLAWFSILVFAIIDAACFQGFLTEGLKRTNAGLGSVIIDSQPLTVAVLSSIFYGEKIGKMGIWGLIVGVVGLLLLEVPYELFTSFFSIESLNSFENFVLDESTLLSFSVFDKGEFWMLLAAQSMAVGTILVRWVCKYNDPIMATGWHMVLGGLPLLLLSYQQHDPVFASDFNGLDAIDYFSFFYASIFGSALSYGVFFYNANKGNLTQLSSLTFLTPMFAATFGFLFLDEILTPFQLFGASITLASIYLVNSKSN